MNPAIEIRKTDDGLVLARRLDGRPLTPEDRDRAKRTAAGLRAPAGDPDAIDLIVDETVVAVLIDSTVLGSPIWFALVDGWTPDPGDKTPVFYARELPALKSKTAEQLRSIFNVKRTFGGGMVRQ